jgi:hypothetical protein
MGTTHYKYKLQNNEYAADYIQTPNFSAAVGGRKIKKNKKTRKYKGGMNSNPLSPASFKGFSGCANWAGGKRRRTSKKLRRKSMKGGIQRKSLSTLVHGGISYEDNLIAGGRKSRKLRRRKSRRH